MKESRMNHCKTVLEMAESSIKQLELEILNLELEGKFNPDRDIRLMIARAELEAERQRRQCVLDVVSELENK